MSSSSNSTALPTLRWGIIATGLISSWFVEDLLLPRPDAKAKHIIQAIGSSSLEKGQAFAAKNAPSASPTIYGSYAEAYADPDVDIVYIGTPHAFHKQNCLDAIAAGKHILCEKAFTITAKEAEQVLAAAKAKGVFIMEAMWTRFTPLVLTLRRMLHEEKVIGDVRRTFCDFGMNMDVASLGPESRLKNPALGAGSLLDIGIYSLTWGLLTLDAGTGTGAAASEEEPDIIAAQTLSHGIDIASSIVLRYPKSGRQGILTSTTEAKTDAKFCVIEGTEGHIVVSGLAASLPSSFTVYTKNSASGAPAAPAAGKMYAFDELRGRGKGFFWEADAVAIDIAAGRKESAIMPHAETLRVMRILDEVRRQGGARFPQDEE